MSEAAIKLSEIKTPIVRVELLSGEVKEYDPYHIVRLMEPHLEAMQGDGVSEAIGRLRGVLGLGAEDASDHHVIVLVRKMTEYLSKEVQGK